MTRGYVCITKGKNEIVNVAYLSSDAYLSWYGLQILKAIENATVNHGINAWVENQRNENIACNGNDNDCKNFALNWIKPDKISRSYDDWSYAEYGYIYDARSYSLKVYYRGKLLLTIDCKSHDEINKYIYLFANEDQIYKAISYDKDKLEDIKPFDKVVKEAAKMTEDELKDLVKNRSEQLYLTDTHCIAPGHRPDREVYQKVLSTSSGEESLKFIVEHNVTGYTDYGWIVLIQTPVVRVPVTISSKKFRSEKALMNALRDFVKPRKNKLIRLALVMERFEQAKKNNMLEAFASECDGLWEEANWFVGNMRYLTKDWFKTEALRYIA